jgi:hypothetical protein
MTLNDLIAALPPLAEGVSAHFKYHPAFEYAPGETTGVTFLGLSNLKAPEGCRFPAVVLVDSSPSTIEETIELLRVGAEPYGFFKALS